MEIVATGCHSATLQRDLEVAERAASDRPHETPSVVNNLEGGSALPPRGTALHDSLFCQAPHDSAWASTASPPIYARTNACSEKQYSTRSRVFPMTP